MNNKDNQLIIENSCFQFSITLTNEIFKNIDDKKNMYFVLKNNKDGKNKRPIYKSHEYNFEYNKRKQTTMISLGSDLLCNNNDELIFFELYCPSKNKTSCVGGNSFTLNNINSFFICYCNSHKKYKKIEKLWKFRKILGI